MKRFAKLTRKYELHLFAQDTASKLIRDEKVADKVYIRNIQTSLKRYFPWDLLEVSKPALSITLKMDEATKAALQKAKQAFQEVNLQAGLQAISKIKNGNLQQGDKELTSSINALKAALKEEKAEGDPKTEGWNAQKKLNYIRMSNYPLYFPKPWQPKNLAMKGIGGNRKFVVPTSEEDFIKGQTPRFNHFLTWGPDCPSCGMVAQDPRKLRLKSKYPSTFGYAQRKRRMQTKQWSPVVPSPGLRPYIAPPPPGSPYYSNPNDPDVETEGVRFFDAKDEKLYYDYLEKYNKFKEEFGKEAEQYNKMFFAAFPHKLTKSRGVSPNQWSSELYGRENPLWEDGKDRPSAEVLKQRIQERRNKGEDI